ncbi:MAG: hypothetical protein JNK84_17875 [Phreatobacter sp.]|uniref:hypothetical protein n=1 Tax=Phreatobacter sp. TaxID=1966341 RepID=UPI001A6467F1|nr:hypothetical protein [Phreatobacter sp.]MBL8570942.1 hypothetical protein [Phreatobacter sp.]
MVGLQDVRDGHPSEGQMRTVVIQLSEYAPTLWSEHFNSEWAQHIYMMKRRAVAMGNTIEIYCVPSELQDNHIPELKKVIDATNARFGAAIAESQRRQAADEKQRRAEVQRLEELKKSLKFD